VNEEKEVVLEFPENTVSMGDVAVDMVVCVLVLVVSQEVCV
jgi:hypothetical protein